MIRTSKSPLHIIPIILALAFLTIHVELFPFGEYQPILLILMALFFLCRENEIGKRQFICANVMFAVGFTSTLLSTDGNLVDSLRIFIAAFFILTGSLIVKRVNLQTIYIIIGAHIFILFFGVISPSLTAAVLGGIFPRGVSYYDGFNSFFASEPSYASINYFGVYLIYKIKFPNKRSVMLELLFAIPLLFTKSITGIIFSSIVIGNIIFTRLSAKNITALLLIAPVFSIGAILFFDFDKTVELLSTFFLRFSYFFNFVSSAEQNDGLVLWAAAEPASSARFIANMSAFSEGTSSFFGSGTFSIEGPSKYLYPIWLRDMFNLNPIISPGINAQTPLFNIIHHSGFFSILPVALIIFYFGRGIGNVKKKSTRNVIILYSIISMFWQSAFVAPIIWIIISHIITLAPVKNGYKVAENLINLRKEKSRC